MLTLEKHRIWQRFVTNGFLKLQIPSTVHSNILAKLRSNINSQINPGNNILPLVPQLNDIITNQKLREILTLILGERYICHPHRYCHFIEPGTKEQDLHRDTYCSDYPVHHYRPRWLLVFYYPHHVTSDMGPTKVIPGSHYSPGKPDTQSEELIVEAGTLVITHYDLWHHAGANNSEHERFMVKFLFTRLSEPYEAIKTKQPSNRFEPGSPESDVNFWYRGHDSTISSLNKSVDQIKLSEIITSNSFKDIQKVRAACLLGSTGVSGAKISARLLIEQANKTSNLTMKDSDQITMKNPAEVFPRYSLVTAGKAATKINEDLLTDPNPIVRATAADALGDSGLLSKSSVISLSDKINDSNPWVRRNVVEALGNSKEEQYLATEILNTALQDSEVQVRLNAVQSTIKLDCPSNTDIKKLIKSLSDSDRYIRYMACIALLSGGPEANKAATDYLQTSYWCPLTSPTDPY